MTITRLRIEIENTNTIDMSLRETIDLLISRCKTLTDLDKHRPLETNHKIEKVVSIINLLYDKYYTEEINDK